jgi:hypothetical protein
MQPFDEKFDQWSPGFGIPEGGAKPSSRGHSLFWIYRNFQLNFMEGSEKL